MTIEELFHSIIGLAHLFKQGWINEDDLQENLCFLLDTFVGDLE